MVCLLLIAFTQVEGMVFMRNAIINSLKKIIENEKVLEVFFFFEDARIYHCHIEVILPHLPVIVGTLQPLCQRIECLFPLVVVNT